MTNSCNDPVETYNLSDFYAYLEKMTNLDNPFEGMELVVEAMATKIYRKKLSGDLYEFRASSTMETVSPDLGFQMYLDLEYRKTWDTYVAEIYRFEEDGKDAIYWQVKYPFPLSNRDYTYRRMTVEEKQNDKVFHVIFSNNFDSKVVPPKKGIIRVTKYKEMVVFSPSPSGGTTMYLEYFDDPGGSIPDWLVRWATKSGVADYLTLIENAIKSYPEYCKTKTAKSK